MYNPESSYQKQRGKETTTKSLFNRPRLLEQVETTSEPLDNQTLEPKINPSQEQLELLHQELAREKAKNQELSSVLRVIQKELQTLQTKFPQNLAPTLDSQHSELWSSTNNLTQNKAYSLSYEELFSSVLRYLHSNISCDLAGILLLEAQSYELFIDTSRDISLAARSQMQQILLDKIATISDRQKVNSSKLDPIKTEQLRPICLHLLNPIIDRSQLSISQIGSYHLVPIVQESETEETVLGLIYVAKESTEKFSDDLVRILSAIAKRTSIYTQQLKSVLEAEQNKLETQKILRALDRAKELNELKTRIIRIVSHEYRTPLTIISLATDLLYGQDGKLTKVQKETCFRKIRDATQQMLQLLEETTLVDRAESQDITFNPLKIEIKTFFERLIADFNQIAAKKYHICFHCHQQIGSVNLDAKLVQQILDNLLSNAIKYSPTDSTITLELTQEPQWIVFKVSDRGIGIPTEDYEYIFDCFHRASNVGTISGTGLGLTIVKKCVELHGGTIDVRSQLHSGTTFTVKLPLI